MIAIIRLERGMPSRGGSSDRLDYVPAICTHRPSLPPIGYEIETLGAVPLQVHTSGVAANSANISLPEEAKAVTR